MTYATEIIQDYRSALRYLWNTHFWRDQGFRDWESVKDFERAQAVLFSGLVSRRLEPLASANTGKVFGSSYSVVPGEAKGVLPNILVNMQSEATPNASWENVVGPFAGGQIKLTAVDFFDWTCAIGGTSGTCL